MIGNDVIDLDDDDSRIACRHPRIDERVLAPSERALLAEGWGADRMRCMLWAAKESAYKLLRRRNPQIVFSPARFVVRVVAAQCATVAAAGFRIAIRFESGDGFVHAIARDEDSPEAFAAVSRTDAQGTGSDSEAVRRFAVTSLAERSGVDADALEIRREGRLPMLLHAGRPVAGALSLSHHGRFVAFAWQPGGAEGGAGVGTAQSQTRPIAAA